MIKNILRHVCILCSFSFAFILSAMAQDQGISGKVLDAFGKNVTVAVNGSNQFKAGDKIDLSYVADTMEFLVGQYEVVQVKGNVFIAKELSRSMPPSKDMKVKIVPAQDLNAMIRNPGQAAPAAEKPPQKGFLDQMGDLFKSPAKTESSDEKIKGEVVAVMGKDVRIKLISDGNPQVGYATDLFFETSAGKQLTVGTWQVHSVNGREVIATPWEGEGIAKVGLKAVIYKSDLPKKSTVPQSASAHKWVVPVETTNRMASNTYNAASTTPVQLEVSPGPPFDPQPGQLNQFPPAYKDFNAFQQAVRNNQPVSVEQKWVLGVQVQNAEGTIWPNNNKFLSGVHVTGVLFNTPAQKAGILPGDIIFHVNNIPVQNVLEFLYLLSASDGKVVLNIKRSPDIYKSIIKTVRLKKFEASRKVGEISELRDLTMPSNNSPLPSPNLMPQAIPQQNLLPQTNIYQQQYEQLRTQPQPPVYQQTAPIPAVNPQYDPAVQQQQVENMQNLLKTMTNFQQNIQNMQNQQSAIQQQQNFQQINQINGAQNFNKLFQGGNNNSGLPLNPANYFPPGVWNK